MRSAITLIGLTILMDACGHAPATRRSSAQVLTGIDVLEGDGFRELQGKRVGLITNATGRDRLGRSSAAVLAAAPGVTLVSIFTPEHGISPMSEAAQISSTTITLAGREIPIHSLFGGGLMSMRLQLIDAERLDALVYDIQDVGARFYTYLATMAMALEEAAKANVEFIVLDRPDPITGTILEGPVLDDLGLRKLYPTAYFAVPIRYGMTIGEIAQLHNAEVKHSKLGIIKLKNWRRELWYDETGLPWTPPSPNMPDLDAAAMYPGIALFEPTNLSVGRGTPLPFRWVGAPWIEPQAVLARLEPALLEGVEFSAQDYTPTKSNFAGLLCHGVRMTITDRERVRPTRIFLKLNEIIRSLYPEELKVEWPGLKSMVGTIEYQLLLERGAGPQKLSDLFDLGPESFAKTREPYLLY
ncbi:MAG: DUF1343 domain-containing protein [Elusimicrobia bacterium]|nr:DUF1343 domain-containing protein [Elusimicrobiota bacterium]